MPSWRPPWKAPLIPSAVASEVADALRSFLSTGFGPSNPELAGVIDEFLAEPEDLVKGPYLSIALPYRAAPEGGEPFPEVPLGYTPYRHRRTAFLAACRWRGAFDGHRHGHGLRQDGGLLAADSRLLPRAGAHAGRPVGDQGDPDLPDERPGDGPGARHREGDSRDAGAARPRHGEAVHRSGRARSAGGHGAGAHRRRPWATKAPSRSCVSTCPPSSISRSSLVPSLVKLGGASTSSSAARWSAGTSCRAPTLRTFLSAGGRRWRTTSARCTSCSSAYPSRATSSQTAGASRWPTACASTPRSSICSWCSTGLPCR